MNDYRLKIRFHNLESGLVTEKEFGTISRKVGDKVKMSLKIDKPFEISWDPSFVKVINKINLHCKVYKKAIDWNPFDNWLPYN